MHILDVDCFGIKYRKVKSSAKKLGKYKAREDLSSFVKERTKKTKDCLKTLKETKSTTEKIMKVGVFLVGPKHKPVQKTAIYEPTSKSLLKDATEILDATLKYNLGVLTKNGVQPTTRPKRGRRKKLIA